MKHTCGTSGMEKSLVDLIPEAIKHLSDDRPCALFYDLDMFEDLCRSVVAAFPSSTLHALAVKSNPLTATLKVAKHLGFGAEVASPAELEHAIQIGFAPDAIVFDSPAKTFRDLRRV